MNLENTNKYLNSKFFTILGLLAVFAVALLFVYGVTTERESRLQNVTHEITQKYAPQQVISGLYIFEESYISSGDEILTFTTESKKYIQPENLNIEIVSTSDSKSRGIFEVPIYTADVKITAEFPPSTQNSTRTLKLYSNGINNIRDIKTSSNLNTFQSTSQHLEQQVYSNGNSKYEISFQITGTKKLSIVPTGLNNNIQITSDWTTPSFSGNTLPISSDINSQGFIANWDIQNPDFFIDEWELDIYQEAIDDRYISTTDHEIGFIQFQENNIYAKTTKSIKYGIFVIGLVFFSFFIVEIFSGQKVNNLQYILIGLSLVIYYSLLLSLGEIIGFALAYLIASLATILLNTFFATLLLKSTKYGLCITSILTTIYLSIFALLQTTQYTLLLGSILAYLIVMISMLASYYINFDNLKNTLNQSNV